MLKKKGIRQCDIYEEWWINSKNFDAKCFSSKLRAGDIHKITPERCAKCVYNKMTTMTTFGYIKYLERGMRQSVDLVRCKQWFAWFPVRLLNGRWTWFTWVNRTIDERPEAYLGLLSEIIYEEVNQ